MEVHDWTIGINVLMAITYTLLRIAHKEIQESRCITSLEIMDRC